MSTLKTSAIRNAASSTDNISLNTNGEVDQGPTVITKPGSDCWLEIGKGATGNNYAYIDLVGDATHTDYALRILRQNGGADSNSIIRHKGSGKLEIEASDAGGQTVILKYAPQIPQALVSFNGTATSSIFCSHNVSSVTDNGTGDYTINFSTGLINNTGSAQGFPMMLLQSSGPINTHHCHAWMGSIGSSSCQVKLYNDENSTRTADGAPVCAAVYG